jgi:hypothetical protein
VVLDLMLALEMGHRSRVRPAVLVSATLYTAVDKVLDACLDSNINHRLALSDLTLVGDALAL